MMKKNRFILLSVLVLAVISLVLILTQSKSTFKRSISDFALADSSNVTKIFMSDKNNNMVTLTRVEPGKWMVNDKYPAQKFNIELLLKTMVDIHVNEPVSKKAHNNIIKRMAANSVKVEIYQWVYRIDLFGWIRWFPHEKLTKVYYVGDATQSNLGTYMLMDRSTQPFVISLPGFRGFVSPRFSPFEKYWRDYTVFSKNITEISSVRVDVLSAPEFSYMVENNGNNQFALLSLVDNREIKDYDTLRLLNFLSGFRSLNFEALLNDMDPHRKDSIINSPPFIVITLTDTGRVTTTVKTYRKQAPAGMTDVNGQPFPYDMDRLYALVNDGQDFTLIQYFVFDKVLRPKTFFLKEPESKK